MKGDLKMDEFQFIEAIQQKTYNQSSLIKGIGDDAAVFRPATYDVVTAVDTFVEGIHFSNKTLNSEQIGYRVLAANISDIAAMGAIPKYYLVSIVIPKSISDDTLEKLYAGMEKIAKEYKVDLIGGDTVSGNQLTISVTIIGYVEKDKARYRHDAENGDIVFVTGTLGNARAGLEVLLHDLDIEDKDFFIKKHQSPIPRVGFSRKLQPLKRLVLNDISDGIANELHEIAKASTVNIIIDDEQIPIDSKLKRFTDEQQYKWKYYGGEDFELVGTVPAHEWNKLQSITNGDVPVTKIGVVTYNTKVNGQVYVRKNEKITLLKKLGYIHLK